MSERENKTVRPARSSGEVIDLLAALQRSIDAAQEARYTAPPGATAPRGPRMSETTTDPAQEATT